MKKIIEIFKNDVKNLMKSKMAVVIIIGIIIIPGIYAWLNIDSNWGPYDNTGNLPIAIVNKDKGTNILGEDVNIGNELEESLKTNTAMKWVFTDEDDARLSVDKGKYYGAIVIPENFSSNISTIMDEGEIKKPVFDFYVNNKKNPIAPIIVNKAVGTIQNSVNQSFVNTILYKTISKAENADIITKTDITTDDLIAKLNDSKRRIQELRMVLKTTDLAADSTSKSLHAIRKLIPKIGNVSETTKQGINDMKNAAKSFDNIYNNIETDISSVLDEAKSEIRGIVDTLDEVNTSNIEERRSNIANKLDKELVYLRRLDSILKSVNEVTQLDIVQNLENKIAEQISKIESVQNKLNDATKAHDDLDNIKNELRQINDGVLSIVDDYKNNVKDKISSIYKSASESVNNVSNIVIDLNVSLENVDLAMKYLIDALGNGGELTNNLDSILDNYETDVDKIIEVIKEAKQSEIYNNIVNVLKKNPSQLADFLSAPVDTNQIDIYPIDTYGSKMAPFYSILACWVGCTILTAILNIEVKKSKVTKGAKHYQKFFGRFMLYGILAMLQGLVIGIGDILLQLQTINGFLFLLTLMLSSLIFILIIYSLTITFGKIGQALSIVIMVLQVAGSGGTFPIELLPRFFQILQPFMPFYPAMNAARETIGGFYQNDYIVYILILLCHMIIPLILGLVVSKYTAKIKEKIEKELEDTDVIG